MSSKAPYLIGGSLILAAGAYYLYSKNKAASAAPAAPAATPATTTAALPSAAGTPPSAADIAALSKLLGTVPATAAAPSSLGKQLGLAGSPDPNAAGDWLVGSSRPRRFYVSQDKYDTMKKALQALRYTGPIKTPYGDAWDGNPSGQIDYASVLNAAKSNGLHAMGFVETVNAVKSGLSPAPASLVLVNDANEEAMVSDFPLFNFVYLQLE